MHNSRRKFIRNTSGTIAWCICSKLKNYSARTTIHIFPNIILSSISPNIFGQFIEYVDQSIDKGIYDKNNSLSDENGFRKDVLTLMKELNPTTLRYPGGTVTKVYHWKDGIGPKNKRMVRKNLIWGGIINNQFGTDEYMTYCKAINTKPFITVNMSTGSAEEAMEWVAYCNDPKDTFWSEQRNLNGSPQPYKVEIRGLGNEEAAKEDAGKLQNVQDYIDNAWYYAKLMKLQDPTIQLVMVGDNELWNEQILKQLHPIADYISLHLYASTNRSNPISLFASIQEQENKICNTIEQIKTLTPKKVEKFSKWYRFPPRQNQVHIALDEWGIWENSGSGKYGLEVEYNWNHALATASMLNAIIRQSAYVTLANWAQSVNVLSVISTDQSHAIKQTVFYPLYTYRKYCGTHCVQSNYTSPIMHYNNQEISCLDIVTTINIDSKLLSIIIVNRSEYKMECPIKIDDYKISSNVEIDTYFASSREGKNTILNNQKDIVCRINKKQITDINAIEILPLSINFILMHIT